LSAVQRERDNYEDEVSRVIGEVSRVTEELVELEWCLNA
jgi:hypothetical protein